ncbi:hypothetical protein EV182_003676 [Spiromyces aspiralis]|uniref:Uncharacterized protein n=1 Tax=Spiromyces aspiralis TaxID=68401 RepID=A0ACC1HK00_9FUNG|nr:hypothetical protein EV182_003676 [Spiromyces aspiralis]
MDPMGGATPVIYFSTQAGAVGRQDTRERPTRHTMWHLTTEKIGCMALNPAEPHCFVTSSLDRTVRVWDVRGVAAPSGEGNSRTPIEIWRRDEKYSVTASYFHSGGHRMVSTCFDNYIRIFDFSGIVSERAAARRRRSARLSSSSSNGGKNGYDESVQPSVDSMVEIPHNNRSGHWVTLLQAIWNSNPEYPPCFVAGNMDRSAEIFCGTTGAVVAKLKDHSVLPTIPAVNKFHPYLPVVVSANAKGKVVVWS